MPPSNPAKRGLQRATLLPLAREIDAFEALLPNLKQKRRTVAWRSLIDIVDADSVDRQAALLRKPPRLAPGASHAGADEELRH